MNNTTFRPLVLTVAALALLGAPALVAPSTARASQAQAAIPPAYTHMITAMASAQSYKLVSDSTGNGGLVMHMERVTLHHGKLAQQYLIIETKTGARRSIAEVVSTGTHVCYRKARAGAWNCRAPAGTVAAYAAAGEMDPKALEALGLRMRIQMSPAGHKVVQKQLCTGYSVTETTTSSYTITSHGTYWLNAATGRPVEMDTVSTYTISGMGNTLAQQLVWSRWNDPSLTIPTPPAS